MERNKILNFLQQNNVEHVKVVVLNQDIHLIDVPIAEAMGE